MEKKVLVFLVLSILLVCCKEKPKERSEQNDKTATKDSLLPYGFIIEHFPHWPNFYKEIAKDVKKGYKSVSDDVFRQKVKELFNEDISTFKYRIQVVTENTKFPPDILLYDNYIMPDTYMFSDIDYNLDRAYSKNKNIDFDAVLNSDELYLKFIKGIINYNNMIFYDNADATNYIKENHPEFLDNLVKTHGYTGNKNWLQFVFSRTELYKPDELESFLFGIRIDSFKETDGGSEAIGQYQLRKEMLEKMLEYGAELSQLSTVANMVSNASQSSYEEDINYLYAYLMAYCFKAGQTGLIEHLYDTNPKMKDVFKEHSYFNVKGLEDYTNTLYIPREKRFGLSSTGPDKFEEYGIINDPDGYTNLRKGKGTSHEVIRKIVEGEKFGIELKEGDWWAVVLEDGTEGWIHKSRVKILKDYSFTDNQ